MKKYILFLVYCFGFTIVSAQCGSDALCSDILEPGTLVENQFVNSGCLSDAGVTNSGNFLFTTSENPNSTGDLFISFENVLFPDTAGDQELQIAVIELISLSISPCNTANWVNTIICTSIDNSTTLSVPETSLQPDTDYIIMVGNTDLPLVLAPTFDISVSGLWVNLEVCCDIEIVQGTEAIITAEGSTIPLTWSSNTEFPLTEIDNQVSLTPLETTVVTVVGEINGCELTYNTTISVIPPITPFNLFTPNGDGVNEVFEIANIEKYTNSIITIFDRWGQKVYTSTGYTQPWDGTNNGRKLPAGTYYYVIELNSLEADIPPISGFTTILY